MRESDRKRLERILDAFEGAVGIPIPYSLAKKMADVIRELREHVETLPAEAAYDADKDHYDAMLGDMR